MTLACEGSHIDILSQKKSSTCLLLVDAILKTDLNPNDKNPKIRSLKGLLIWLALFALN